MTTALTCAVCGARGRIPPEAGGESVTSLRWLCAAHSAHTGALLAGWLS